MPHGTNPGLALEGMLVAEAMPTQRVLYYIVGYVAVAAGLFMLIGALVNSPYISW